MGGKSDKDKEAPAVTRKPSSTTNTPTRKSSSPSVVTTPPTTPVSRSVSVSKTKNTETSPKEPKGSPATYSLPGVITNIDGTGPPVMKSFHQDSTTLNISANGLELSVGYSYYGTHHLAKANVKVSKGRWYYEVTLRANGSARIGWCTDKYIPENQNSGLGNDENSWGFDGSQQRKFFKNSSGEAYGEYWQVGDVIGTLIDFEQRRIMYYRNGKELGPAFSNVRSDVTVIPAVSLQSNANLVINFGKSFKYAPVGVFGLNTTVPFEEKKSIEEIFDKYCKLSGDDGDPSTSIKNAGAIQLATDLGSTGPTDPLIMILAWKMRSSDQWDFTKEEWTTMWALQGVYTENQMVAKAKEWREELKDDLNFKNFYSFIFEYLKPRQATVLESSDALMAWKMCGFDKKWKLFEKWEDYWKQTAIKGVSKDTWMMLVNFIENLGDKIDQYDENDCWPTAIDDFVMEYLKKGQ